MSLVIMRAFPPSPAHRRRFFWLVDIRRYFPLFQSGGSATLQNPIIIYSIALNIRGGLMFKKIRRSRIWAFAIALFYRVGLFFLRTMTTIVCISPTFLFVYCVSRLGGLQVNRRLQFLRRNLPDVLVFRPLFHHPMG